MMQDLVQAILSCKYRSNLPHPHQPGKRVVGWVLDEDVAGLSDSLFAIEEIERLAKSAPSAMDRNIAKDQIILLARELGRVTEQLKTSERECRKLLREARRANSPHLRTEPAGSSASHPVTGDKS